MTINEFRKKATNLLEEITENAGFEADQLIQFVLGINHNELIIKRRSSFGI